MNNISFTESHLVYFYTRRKRKCIKSINQHCLVFVPLHPKVQFCDRLTKMTQILYSVFFKKLVLDWIRFLIRSTIFTATLFRDVKLENVQKNVSRLILFISPFDLIDEISSQKRLYRENWTDRQPETVKKQVTNK